MSTIHLMDHECRLGELISSVVLKLLSCSVDSSFLSVALCRSAVEAELKVAAV